MNIHSLSGFLRVVEHEFDGVSYDVPYMGYKMDGEDGIRNSYGLTQLKSVDYFTHISGASYFIEFSDLLRQRNMISERISKIKTSNLDKETKRCLIKKENAAMHTELINKYMQSRYPIELVAEKEPDILTKECKKIYLAVYAPPHSSIPQSSLVELFRFLDILKSGVSSQINKRFCTEFLMLSFEDFIKHRSDITLYKTS